MALLAFALAQASASVRADTISLLPTNSFWKYLDTGADPGVAWRAPTFNDSGWATGRGPLGYGETWLNTVLNIGSGTNRLLTAYFRRSFVVTNAGAVIGLTTRLLRDDGAVVYLNGTDVLRHNMPAGPVNYWTLATTVIGGTDETTYFPNAIPPSLLVNGTNRLAAEVHQNSAASTDLTFDLELIAATGTPPSTNPAASVVLNEILAHNQSVTNGDGTVTDWVELHNPAEQPVDLADCSLSDSPTTPRRWVFPPGTVLPPGGFLVVRCDATAPPSTNYSGALNTGFELPANGGAIYLFDCLANGGGLLDALSYGLQAADLSLSRVPDASGAWTLCQPTAASTNVAASLGNPAALKVNEWMAAPAEGEDWFELFNPQPQPVALGGLHLSDDLTQRTKHPIPPHSYIGGGVRGYAVFWADGNPAAGADHTNFRLSNSGEALCLSTSSGDMIDAVAFGAQQTDVSEGRLPDGATNLVRFPLSATPGAANGPPPVEPPVITLQPASLTLSAGQPATFVVRATGTPPLTFQWLFDGNPVAGATNATLTLSNAQPRHWGEYHVAVSNAAGSVMSSGAQLRLWPLFGWGGTGMGAIERIPAGLTNVTALAAGDDFVLALKPDGTVSAWPASPGTPVPADVTNAVAVSAGTGFSVALRNNGTVSAWGWGWDDETNVPPGLTDVVALDCGTAHTIALRRDGTVVTWGINPDGRNDLPPGLGGVVAVSAGTHNLALRADGIVVGWGFNHYGQADVPADLSNIVAVAAGGDFSVVLKADGTVRAWGASYAGQDAPPAGLSNVVAIAAGWDHALALLCDGRVAAWGNDYRGAVSIPIGLDRVIGLAPGGEFEAEFSLVRRGHGAPVITVQPVNRTVNAGEAVRLTAFAVGQPPLRYQWFFNDHPLAGATQPNLLLPPVQLAQGGRYVVSISNAFGTAFSREVTLSVVERTNPPVILTPPTSLTCFAGQTATFTVEASGTPPLCYQWFRDEVPLSGQTNATLVFPSVQFAEAGSYSVTVSNAAGSVFCGYALLTVLPAAGQPGSVDPGFHPGFGADDAVNALALRPDGRILIGGAFTSFDGVPREHLAQLHGDGQVDLSFDPGTGADFNLYAVALQRDGQALIGGGFTSFNGQPQRYLARLRADGSVDAGFAPQFNEWGWVLAVAVQNDDRIVIGGDFTSVNGETRNRIARLNADGSLDASFQPTPGVDAGGSTVMTLAVQPDGKVILGGVFERVNGVARRHIARLNADGTLDPTFDPGTGADSTVWAVAWQPDGKIVMGGYFTSVHGVSRRGIARLHANGSLDLSFDPGTGVAHADSPAVHGLALQSDGKILAAGWFVVMNGVRRTHLARLNPDGSLDPAFAADIECFGWGGGLSDVVVQPDGQVLIAGNLENVNGTPRRGIARLHNQAGVPPCIPAPASLVAWWPGNRDGMDVVGGNHGVSHGAAFAPGKVGPAFSFDGSSYLEVPEAPALRLQSELTIEFWVRRERLEEPHYIVEKGGDWTWGEQNYAVALHTGAYDHCLHFLFAGGWRGGGRIADTNWHHCAVTARHGETNPALYIDGVQQAVVYGEGAETIELHPSTRPLHIGAQIDPQSGWFYYHRGRIDELSFYDRVLSGGEIEAIYRAGSSGKCLTSAPPAFVERRIETPMIQLATTPPASVSVYAVEDQPPAGWPVTNISHSGVWDGATGKVKFGPFYDAEPRALSYEVGTPVWGIHCALGVFCFSGRASADGVNSPVGGQQCLALAGYFPADVTPADQQISIGEVTAYGAAWRRGSNWLCHPQGIPIDYVTRAAFLWRAGECYVVDPAITRQPLWWVACGTSGGADVQSAGTQVFNLRSAARQMPAVFVPGEPFTVTVATQPGTDTRAHAVEEAIPTGWTVSAINGGGDFDAAGGKVKWGPFFDATPRTLNYRVNPPVTALGIASFSGVMSCDGASVRITGAGQVREACRITLISPPASGPLQLTLSGRLGARCVVEASSDLATWTVLVTVTNTNGRLMVTDPDFENHRARFYRARLLD